MWNWSHRAVSYPARGLTAPCPGVDWDSLSEQIPNLCPPSRVPHLHVHTHFSFGIGVSSPDVLAAAAAERGFATLACTDTNGVYGAVEFQRACEAAGVRPILGAHLVTDHEETVALATDERGWGALCRAITRIHWDGRSAGPVIPSEARDLLEHSERAQRSGNASKVPRFARDDGSDRLSTSLAPDREGLILLSRDP